MTKEELRKQWEIRIADYKTNGQSQANWCTANDIKTHQLHYWLRKFKSGEVASTIPVKESNWLSIDIDNYPRGAKASAIIYSIVETAKENKLNPYYYLRYLFEELPNLDPTDISSIDNLLPWSETLPIHCKVFNQLPK